MRSSKAYAVQKVYEEGDITSNKVNTMASQLIDKFDQEEAAKILLVRQGAQGDDAQVDNFDGWLEWDEAKATEMEASADPEAKIRAHYRLGLLNINKAGMLVKSRRHFEKVAELDGEFCKH